MLTIINIENYFFKLINFFLKSKCYKFMKFHPLKTFLGGSVPPMHDFLSMSYTCRHEAHDGPILASTQPQISDQSLVQLGSLKQEFLAFPIWTKLQALSSTSD